MNDREKDKYLILSATFGEGHKQVANAISEAVDFFLADAEPVTIDIMEWIHPHLYPISHYIYNRGINKFPQVYSFFYRKTRVKNSFSVRLNSLFLLGMQTMLKIIQEIKPKVVVSTYPFAAGIISKLKEQGLIDIPAVTIITDYTDHSYWIYPYTDQYIVGSTQVRDRLIALGVEENKIKHTGIPVRKRFTEVTPKAALLDKYQLDANVFTILIMGGGDGFFSKGLSTFQTLESISAPLQIFIVCGKNKKLKKQLEWELKDSKHDVRILGYCENINELMAISDLMITKPGGVTISEAMVMDLPLLIYHSLPGQEEDNAEYLYRSGFAFISRSEKDLLEQIENLVHDSAPLIRMKQRMEENQTKTSSQDALRVIDRAAKRGQIRKSSNRRVVQKREELEVKI
ncbi:MGDG synthase family glycosyltransferase [Bacillus benzoevorans]|uniref:Processive 1,2-diacylglycerol beta-glucosyltransferase n=1 Tax=Bacillus benzoevorans TaxID=1456 RepID=A0A7X0HRJ9_9BACI|nr:glycosyltransferase [Bacillus benzoevorans]MBB6445613.1 processive 1,2-diacylglycerol beta-glucosyltransferase [Bacillus benzoevorans]